MEFISYIILEVAHYKQVVVSSWIVQALCFYSIVVVVVKNLLSVHWDQKGAKIAHIYTLRNYNFFKNIILVCAVCFLICLLFQHMGGVII